jgi:hypothetical protein
MSISFCSNEKVNPLIHKRLGWKARLVLKTKFHLKDKFILSEDMLSNVKKRKDLGN